MNIATPCILNMIVVSVLTLKPPNVATRGITAAREGCVVSVVLQSWNVLDDQRFKLMILMLPYAAHESGNCLEKSCDHMPADNHPLKSG